MAIVDHVEEYFGNKQWHRNYHTTPVAEAQGTLEVHEAHSNLKGPGCQAT